MSVEENKAIVRRCIDEAFNKGNTAAMDEFLAANVVPHPLPLGVPHDLEGLKRFFTTLLAAFPDYCLTIEDMIGEGDKVVIRSAISGTHKGEFMGIASTGKKVTWTAIEIWRIEGRKVVEIWGEVNQVGVMQQLGAIPPPGHG
jgi:predicted ester cyclase